MAQAAERKEIMSPIKSLIGLYREIAKNARLRKTATIIGILLLLQVVNNEAVSWVVITCMAAPPAFRFINAYTEATND